MAQMPEVENGQSEWLGKTTPSVVWCFDVFCEVLLCCEDDPIAIQTKVTIHQNYIDVTILLSVYIPLSLVHPLRPAEVRTDGRGSWGARGLVHHLLHASLPVGHSRPEGSYDGSSTGKIVGSEWGGSEYGECEKKGWDGNRWVSCSVQRKDIVPLLSAS